MTDRIDFGVGAGVVGLATTLALAQAGRDILLGEHEHLWGDP